MGADCGYGGYLQRLTPLTEYKKRHTPFGIIFPWRMPFLDFVLFRKPFDFESLPLSSIISFLLTFVNGEEKILKEILYCSYSIKLVDI